VLLVFALIFSNSPPSLVSNWRAAMLMAFGFIGGVLTAIFGR
jgi:hypothetical protein